LLTVHIEGLAGRLGHQARRIRRTPAEQDAADDDACRKLKITFPHF
jgi:hypothetical protein